MEWICCHQFETRKDWTYCSIFAISTYFIPEKNDLDARFSAIFFNNLRPKRNQLIVQFFTIFYNLRPEMFGTVTEIITIGSFNLRTGIQHETLCLWRDQLWGSWGLLNKMTTSKRSNISFAITSTQQRTKFAKKTFLRRLKQRLFQVDFPKNPWFNTCLQLAQYIIIIPRESISILI